MMSQSLLAMLMSRENRIRAGKTNRQTRMPWWKPLLQAAPLLATPAIGQGTPSMYVQYTACALCLTPGGKR